MQRNIEPKKAGEPQNGVPEDWREQQLSMVEKGECW